MHGHTNIKKIISNHYQLKTPLYIESLGLNVNLSYHNLSFYTNRQSRIIVFIKKYFIFHKLLYAIKCTSKGKEIYRPEQSLRVTGD